MFNNVKVLIIAVFIVGVAVGFGGAKITANSGNADSAAVQELKLELNRAHAEMETYKHVIEKLQARQRRARREEDGRKYAGTEPKVISNPRHTPSLK